VLEKEWGAVKLARLFLGEAENQRLWEIFLMAS
jgi:hypothetical protein